MKTRPNRRTKRDEYRASCPICAWRAPEWVRTKELAQGQQAEHEEMRGCEAAARDAAAGSAWPVEGDERFSEVRR